MSGRLLVTPRHGYLELLGRLDGALDRPDLLDELPSTDPAPVLDPLGLRCGGRLAGGGRGHLLRDETAGRRDGLPAGTLAAHAVRAHVVGRADLAAERSGHAPPRGAAGSGALPIRQAGPFLVRYDVVGSTCDAVPRRGRLVSRRPALRLDPRRGLRPRLGPGRHLPLTQVVVPPSAARDRGRSRSRDWRPVDARVGRRARRPAGCRVLAAPAACRDPGDDPGLG